MVRKSDSESVMQLVGQKYAISTDHITSHHITSYHITSYHITSHHITSYHITSHHITSYHITSHHITSHHITSHHITSHHITSHHITTHHITSYHIISHYIITLHHIPHLDSTRGPWWICVMPPWGSRPRPLPSKKSIAPNSSAETCWHIFQHWNRSKRRVEKVGEDRRRRGGERCRCSRLWNTEDAVNLSYCVAEMVRVIPWLQDPLWSSWWPDQGSVTMY